MGGGTHVMPLGSAWSNGAAGVHSGGILHRLDCGGGAAGINSLPWCRLAPRQAPDGGFSIVVSSV